eukprot:9060181-Lingulodinium_polyedra.AAC.1
MVPAVLQARFQRGPSELQSAPRPPGIRAAGHRCATGRALRGPASAARETAAVRWPQHSPGAPGPLRGTTPGCAS